MELVAFTLASLFLAPAQRSDPAISWAILILIVTGWATMPLWASAILDAVYGPDWSHWVIPPMWYAATLLANGTIALRR